MSVFNTLLGSVDWLLYRRDMAAQALHPEPIFILGHPRTGTTHVHNLMALDPRFACARTLHAGFPSAFLWLERFQWALAGLIDDTRPMDMMPLSFATPAEDEIATSALTGDVSAYLPLLFMRDHKQLFSDFYTFEGATAEDSRRWRDALLWFLRKVTLRCSWDDAAAAQHGGSRGSSAGRAGSAGAPPPAPRPLLIKSPVHTARVRTLLQLFPRARFIYVHRDPLEVFASAAHMADTYYWYCYLQTPGDADVTDFILDQYELLHRTYTADRALILPGRLVKVSFAELDGSPLGTLRRIYSGLGLEGFEAVRPACEAYCRGLHLKGFKKNAHRPLSPDLRRRVARRWGLLAAEFGYRISAGEGDAAADAVAARGEAAAV
ncbi:P-loop containing nucleoside triphosphate hydrolase [Micractinium conductrix]|uniref:P-loop containing nucleoside triphosphate hydrolase n=1 Tax=Micractinium conductrix TaxID=554055 RepID=A0A2P6VJV4_9CHLO|nr:P-loop containing nucleoside triphosphate hydrolase [Micractinium conductrix]|eukprot:PSC74347.1 P-loop containing nucleoside triphosphate hydrolase [Micractinium conductrix]